MRRAAGPTSTGRTASPSTPGRPSSPRPSCSRSCGRCAAGAWPTTSSCGRSTPFYRIRFDDGACFDYTGDPDAMRAEVARFSPGDVAGYERFMAASEAHLPGRLRAARPRAVRLLDRHGADRCPSWCGSAGYRTVYGAGLAATSATRGCAWCSASIRCWSAATRSRATSIYSLIAFLERRWGVHFAMGGTGRLVRGLVGLIEGQGGAVRCDAEVARDHWSTDGRATGVRLASGEDDRGRRRGLQRRLRLDLPAPAGAASTAGAGPTGGSSGRATRWACSSGTSAPGGNIPTSRTTRSCSARATASCCDDIFERKVLAEDFSLYLHRPDRDRSVAGARRAATRSTCCRRCRIWTAAPTGPTTAEPYRQRDRAPPGRNRAARASEDEIVTSRMLTPQDFQDRLLLVPRRRRSAWSRS